MSKQTLKAVIDYLAAQQAALTESGAPNGVWVDVDKMMHATYINLMSRDLSDVADAMPDGEASPSHPEPSITPMANVIRAPQRGGGKP